MIITILKREVKEKISEKKIWCKYRMTQSNLISFTAWHIC